MKRYTSSVLVLIIDKSFVFLVCYLNNTAVLEAVRESKQSVATDKIVAAGLG